ncbi:MAG: hypothetical protein AB8G11_08710 [Saprospiraceae bacterium]
MKNLLNNLLFVLVAVVTLTIVSCTPDSDDDPVIDPTDGTIVVTENIAADATWTSDNVYELAGRIAVLDGVTLTIEAGTIIKGRIGTGANATALLIARGGKLMAEGTATSPIIFTTAGDLITTEDIATGNFASPNLEPTISGLWGGLIVLGKAPISASNDNNEDISEVQIEGIPTSDANGLYGGTDAADNSGVLKYISIRHGGANIGAGNEINGLTLGGVGSGTVVEYIEVVGNQDDGIEWFGGTVNTSNVVVWNAGDDAIDTDQSWAGTLDNFVVLTPSDNIFELDGPEGSMVAGHVIKNGSVKASSDDVTSDDLINSDDNSDVDLENIYFTDIVGNQQINKVTFPDGDVTFTNIVLDVVADSLGNYVNGAVPAGVTAGTSSQADVSVLDWTWAGQAGMLDF